MVCTTATMLRSWKMRQPARCASAASIGRRRTVKVRRSSTTRTKRASSTMPSNMRGKPWPAMTVSAIRVRRQSSMRKATSVVASSTSTVYGSETASSAR